jgi:type VII secretion protein EccB
MAARTEHLRAHQFTMQRVTAALALRDPDPVGSPIGRGAGAAFAGVMVAVVALAAVAAYGVLRPGDDTSWREGRSVIIERETGARFVYRGGLLHPTLNYASALLILGSSVPATAIVSHASLADVPRGVPLGIVGAPDPLPAARDLLTGAWTLCSRSGAGSAESLLVVGGPVAKEQGGEPLGPRAAVLAVDPTGAYHLLWHGHRYAIRDPGIVLTALAWRGRSPVAIAAALLNAVPAGDDLAPMRVVGPGRHSAVPGHRVGEVVVGTSQSGARQFGLVRPEGIAAITQVQADLLLADPANDAGGGPVALTAAQLAAAPQAPSLEPTGDSAPPATTPDLLQPHDRGGVCASFVDAATQPRLSVYTARPGAAGETHAARAGVDWIAVQPGHGSIVDSVAAPADGSGLLGVVSDLGVFSAVPSAAVLATLGYSGVRPQELPSALVALLPRGNPLDPAAVVVPA